MEYEYEQFDQNVNRAGENWPGDVWKSCYTIHTTSGRVWSCVMRLLATILIVGLEGSNNIKNSLEL